MLQITCPYCGVRDEEEFHFGGEAHVQRPGLSVTDAEWGDYLFNRRNPKGEHAERWSHRDGCGRWFNTIRDTVTHEIVKTYEMGESNPEVKGT